MKEITVALTGACGQIAYSLLPRLLNGEVFGKDTLVNVNLIEIPQALERLKGTVMELDDCAFPNAGVITPTADLEVGFKNVDWALLVGAMPRGPGMERSDLLAANGGIFKGQGKAIGEHANDNANIIVVGNPANH